MSHFGSTHFLCIQADEPLKEKRSTMISEISYDIQCRESMLNSLLAVCDGATDSFVEIFFYGLNFSK